MELYHETLATDACSTCHPVGLTDTKLAADTIAVMGENLAQRAGGARAAGGVPRTDVRSVGLLCGLTSILLARWPQVRLLVIPRDLLPAPVAELLARCLAALSDGDSHAHHAREITSGDEQRELGEMLEVGVQLRRARRGVVALQGGAECRDEGPPGPRAIEERQQSPRRLVVDPHRVVAQGGHDPACGELAPRDGARERAVAGLGRQPGGCRVKHHGAGPRRPERDVPQELGLAFAENPPARARPDTGDELVESEPARGCLLERVEQRPEPALGIGGGRGVGGGSVDGGGLGRRHRNAAARGQEERGQPVGTDRPVEGDILVAEQGLPESPAQDEIQILLARERIEAVQHATRVQRQTAVSRGGQLGFAEELQAVPLCLLDELVEVHRIVDLGEIVVKEVRRVALQDVRARS